MQEFDIYIEDFDDSGREAPEEALHRLFGLDLVRALEFVESVPRVVKRHVPGSELERYAQALREMGARYELRPSPIEPRPTIAVEGAAAAAGEREKGGPVTGRTLTLPPPLAGAVVPEQGCAKEPSPGDTWVESQPPPEVVALAATAAHLAPTDPAPARSLPNDMARTYPEGVPLHAAGASSADITLLESVPPPSRAASADATLCQSAPPPARQSVQPISLPPPSEPPLFPGLEEPSSHADALSPVWGGIAPQPDAAAPVWAPPPQVGELPPAADVPGLGRPGADGWVLGEPTVQARRIDLQSLRPPREPLPGDPMRKPAPHRVPAATSPRAGGAAARRPVVRPLPVSEPRPLPLLLRVALVAGLGLSLFLIVTVARQCSSLFGDRAGEHLAQWGSGDDFDSASEAAAGPASSAPRGPKALDWMRSETHLFSHPDKDRIRGIISRYLEAGAVAVYVGGIRRETIFQRASQLIVELPPRGANRTRLFAAHKAFYTSTADRLGAPDSLEDEDQDVIVIQL